MVNNAFPEYTPIYKTLPNGKKEIINIFRGVDLGHGGYVYAEPGCYCNVALLDSASHHPTSAINLGYFGDYTQRYKDILDIRLAIKHGEFEKARTMFDGKLAKYLDDPQKADQLTQALKICCNSTYGVTSAKYENIMTHPDNKNNIIALRGAIALKIIQDAVVERGYKVIHCKTDSVKIPNADSNIIQFVIDKGHELGYNFELEAIYDRMCLVNQSTYIAKFATPDLCQRVCGDVPGKNKKKGGKWDPTGAQFAHPVVFKTLFSKEAIDEWDYAETKEVTGGNAKIYLDFNENLPDVRMYEDELIERDKERDGKKRKKTRYFENLSDDDLRREIAKGHAYRFVGKVGLYLPMEPGAGGGELMVLRNGKYSSVNGTKDYRWQEFEIVREAGMLDRIDMRYYRKLVDEAIHDISEYCDFEWFANNDDPPSESNHPLGPGDIPWYMPCKDPSKSVCEECSDFETCPYLHDDSFSKR